MAELRAMLDERKGDTLVEDWISEINQELEKVATNDKKIKMRLSTLYSYLNGQRNITGKGAKALAMYFHSRGDVAMVNAIINVTLGIPYGNDHNQVA